MTIEVCDFGEGAARLLAEFDEETDVVRVNRRAVDSIRARSGEAEAQRFLRCAIAHEMFHRAHPHAAERSAREHAREACGVDPAFYEALLQA